jgi:hypothetical protein
MKRGEELYELAADLFAKTDRSAAAEFQSMLARRREDLRHLLFSGSGGIAETGVRIGEPKK